MPMVYTSALATPGNSATSATPGTETNAIYLKPASAVPARVLALMQATLIGKGAGLTAISGIVGRVIRCTTASTSGTATTPNPKDAGFQAATATASTGGTTSTTGRSNHMIFGCGATSLGQWSALTPDNVLTVSPAATQPSIDLVVASGTASLNYEFSVEHSE